MLLAQDSLDQRSSLAGRKIEQPAAILRTQLLDDIAQRAQHPAPSLAGHLRPRPQLSFAIGGVQEPAHRLDLMAPAAIELAHALHALAELPQPRALDPVEILAVGLDQALALIGVIRLEALVVLSHLLAVARTHLLPALVALAHGRLLALAHRRPAGMVGLEQVVGRLAGRGARRREGAQHHQHHHPQARWLRVSSGQH